MAVDPHGLPPDGADPVLRAWFKVWDHLTGAITELRRVEHSLKRSLRPEPRVAYSERGEIVAVGDELAGPIQLWCVNCARYGYQWPAAHKKAGRCRPCRDYQYAHGGDDAPRAVIEARYERRERDDEKRLA